MNGHHNVVLPSKTLRHQSLLFPKTRKYTSYIRYISNESFSFFLFLNFISVLLSQLPENNDPRFYLFPVSGIECPMCTNVPGLGAGKCDSGKVPKVTCPDGLNQCMSLKGKMTVLGFTQSIELKNCSNNVLCHPASDFNGKNSNEFSRPPHPSALLW